MVDTVTVGVDVGGTKVAAGVVTPDGRVLTSVRAQTPHRDKSPEVVEQAITDVVREVTTTYSVGAVGVGAAGFVDVGGSSVMFSPHLSWRREPLRAALEARLGLPVLLDNDANASAHAEVRFGAARGFRQVVCLTLGTGIGGALVVDGALFRGANGMAGEFGHMQVVSDGLACECGNLGCWEQYVSGNALVRRARELVARSSDPAPLRELMLEGLTGPAVTAAARSGDSTVVLLFAEAGAWLGRGLANLAAAFDPELIVVGGGLSEAGDLLLDPARDALHRALPGRGYRSAPALVSAALGVDAGFVGAADLARRLLT